MRKAPGTILVLLSAVALCAPARGQGMKAVGSFTHDDIERAIKKGVEYLWSVQKEDGSWGVHSGTATSKRYPSGLTAMACYALLEAGVSVQDERMKKALDWLVKHQREDTMTYTVGLRCNVWLAANRQTRDKYRLNLLWDVNRLVYTAGVKEGSYTYYTLARGETAQRNRVNFCPDDRQRIAKGGQPLIAVDNSNGQYGLLGVWAGKRNRIEVPTQYWALCMKYWMRQQRPDGGWNYSGGGNPTYGSMSAGGLASMFVCFDALRAKEFRTCTAKLGTDWQAIQKGLAWFDKNFKRTLTSPRAADMDAFYYYMFGVERVGLASGYKYFGKVDWFREGTRRILANQAESGAWRSAKSGSTERNFRNIVGTSYALLFLSRGRRPVLFNKLEFPGDWNNRPRDLANLTAWMSRTFEGRVNWQIVTLKSPVGDWHDAPILYISGAKAPTFTKADIEKLRTFVYQGGTIFSCTECRGAGFRTGIRKIYARMFPGLELKRVLGKHDLHTIQFPTRGRPVYYQISNGIRPLVIHTDMDLPLAWQINAVIRQRASFQTAANLYLYLTDKGSLRYRGVHLWPGEAKFAPAATVKLARVKYKGRFDPEPLALERFRRLMGARYKVKVELAAEPVEAANLATAKVHLAVMTGIGSLPLAAEEKRAIKAFTDGGGALLIDAAGGDEAFFRAAEKVLKEIYGPESLKPLPPTSPIYRLKGLEVGKVEYRRATLKRTGKKKPRLLGVIKAGRAVAILSREDLTAGLVGYPSYACDGYKPASAFALVCNIAFHAAKVDASSSPTAE